MKPRYEVTETPFGHSVINAYFEDGRMLSIPIDESNSDYQAYLKSLDEAATL
jgi:hypothetical protein